MTRLEQIIQPMTVGERLAIVGALFMAQDNKDEFAKRYGVYGVTNLEALLASDNKVKP